MLWYALGAGSAILGSSTERPDRLPTCAMHEMENAWKAMIPTACKMRRCGLLSSIRSCHHQRQARFSIRIVEVLDQTLQGKRLVSQQ